MPNSKCCIITTLNETFNETIRGNRLPIGIRRQQTPVEFFVVACEDDTDQIHVAYLCIAGNAA